MPRGPTEGQQRPASPAPGSRVNLSSTRSAPASSATFSAWRRSALAGDPALEARGPVVDHDRDLVRTQPLVHREAAVDQVGDPGIAGLERHLQRLLRLCTGRRPAEPGHQHRDRETTSSRGQSYEHPTRAPGARSARAAAATSGRRRCAGPHSRATRGRVARRRSRGSPGAVLPVSRPVSASTSVQTICGRAGVTPRSCLPTPSRRGRRSRSRRRRAARRRRRRSTARSFRACPWSRTPGACRRATPPGRWRSPGRSRGSRRAIAAADRSGSARAAGRTRPCRRASRPATSRAAPA